MDLRIELSGTTPYLMHSIQSVDPDLAITREIKAITSKKSKMTEEDRRQVERLEWHSGLYLDSETGKQLVVPVRNVKKCFIESGVITRDGKNVARALSFTSLEIPLLHSGNGSLEKMYESGKFTSRLAVGIGRSRTMRVRPEFMPWGLVFQAYLFEEAMDPDVFTRIVERAGVTIGLGDNRQNGYGRFTATVTRLS
jgi:hypothetical protein